ncbi:FecCD family ABC transporter permease [Paracoccus aminophilus]|uniref:FecCD family ABC transporter permease n=1 Tax=Paracoccus aminophilus TaxID=34003 RepID=UPI000400F0B2|nr:iron ABC transporter permease [Paracoccus aminophilus]
MGLFALLVLGFLGLATGSRPIPPGTALAALFHHDPSNDLHLIVSVLRIPRTLLAMLVGAALGLAGALMQAATRNPLAEPGLLGISAGASVAVILAIAAFQLHNMAGYVWFGMLGAGLAGAAVFLLGRAHLSGTDPVRLVLAGAGISVVLGAVTGLVIMNAPLSVLDNFRNWAAGSVEGRDMGAVAVMAVALACGGGLALALAGPLNALALGQELGQTLGVRPARIWALTCLAVMVLAGPATAAAGPIGFIGLVAPHLARMAGGPDYRWILPLSALFAASLLLGADVIGRVLAPPSEIAAGIIATLIGGPFFVWTVRKFRLARL